MSDSLHTLGAAAAAAAVRAGRVSSADLVGACLQRIAADDGRIGAWRHLDADLALAQAGLLDDIRRRGQPVGDLHGVPVGIKDIFDTRDMPTRHGSPIHENRRPGADSAVVERLREAGAVILGKTVTTEFAGLTPAGTRNPIDPARTPGGSSSGSAAAVGAQHVPVAIGSQTSGSTIRPASFCGVHGFKPSRGIVSRRGCLRTAGSLDQVGLFARSLEDLALLGDVLAGHDHADEASVALPRPRMREGLRAEVPVEPDFVWLDMPFDDRLTPSAAAAFEELRDVLGPRIERIAAPASVAGLLEHHRVIRTYEIRRSLAGEIEHHWDALSPVVQETARRAEGISDARYRESLAMLAGAEAYFRQFFNDYDAIVAPAAPGEAPAVEAGTGDPVFNTIWTFCGLPCLSLPLMAGEAGLPIGTQLVGAHFGDDRLFRTARWLLEHLRADAAATTDRERIEETP